MTSVAHLAVKAGLAVMHGRSLSRLIRATKAPAEAQAEVLEGILATNAQTTFGERHGFAALRNPADYRKAVPVQSYEDLRADIETQELTGERRLTAEAPVYYNRTSGTVAAPKNIPVTESGLKRNPGPPAARGVRVLERPAHSRRANVRRHRRSGGRPHARRNALWAPRRVCSTRTSRGC